MKSRIVAFLATLALSCGPASHDGGETTPTMPGEDPVGAVKAQPVEPVAAKPGQAEPDPWAGRKDLIQPPPLKPPAKVALPTIERFELPNGLQVIVIENHELPVASFHLAVRAGQQDEAREKRGVADIAAAMLTKGTKKRSADQIAQSIDQVGGQLGAGVDLEATHITCQTLSKDVATCLDLLPDVTTNPTFADKELTEVRKQVTGAIKQRRDDPSLLAEDHFENALWGEDHVRGWPVTLDTIGAIQRQDLIEWHGARFKPNNAVLAIAGDVDAKEIRAQVQKAFGAWQKGAAPEAKKFAEPVLKGMRVRLVDKPDQSQSQIVVGHLGIAHGDPDYFATTLVNYTLGGGGFSSRLMKVVRSQGGKTYGASSGFERYRTRGAFRAKTFTRNEETLPTLKLVLGEIAKMQKDGLNEVELADAKSNIAGNYPLAFESAGAIAAAVMAAELHGLGETYVREFPVKIAGVPLADARAAAKAHLDADDLVVVIVGKAETVAPQLKKAAIPFELVDWLAPVSKRDREAKAAAKKAPADPKKAAEGRKLLDQAILARGGAAKLIGLKDMSVTGTMTIFAQGKNVSGDYARYFKAPDQQRSDVSLPGRGTVKLVVSPASAWVEFQGKVQEVPPDSLSAIGVLLFVDPERILLHGQDKKVVLQSTGPQTVEGTDYDGVLVRSADGLYEAILLLDPKTHLLYRVVYQVEGETLFDEYAEYKAVAGVQVAHKIKTVNLLLQVPVEISYDKVQINGGLPAGAFDRAK